MKYLISLLSDKVNPWVFGFFAIGALLLLLISSYYLWHKKNKTFRLFGVGLVLTGLAFTCWSYVTGFHPENIGLYTNIGVLLFLGALISFFLSYTSTIKRKKARIAYWAVGTVALVAFITLRFVLHKSNPGFSEDGFFSFNIDQLVVYAYVVLIAFSMVPAAYGVAAITKSALLAGVTRFGFSLITIGTAILITSPDNYMQIINGTGMVVGIVMIAATHIFVPLESK
ncbi:MAG: hypothetical protein WCK26_00250 [Candidatus Saccharibacteria bacterium]